jgi:hypothetical protein
VTAHYLRLTDFTKRWAFPAAVILLPGGFVLLAVGLACRRFLLRPALTVSTKRTAVKRAAPPASEIVLTSPAFLAIVRANMLHARAEDHCACIRHGAMRRRAPVSAVGPSALTTA